MSPHRNHVEARANRRPVRQFVSDTHDHKPDAGISIKTHQRLILQRNGVVALETRAPGLIRISLADDLRYRIELKTNRGWESRGEHKDERTARKTYAERNKFFRWRMVAFNDIGYVRLPDSWRGGPSW
ncbi:hypothetical protein ASC80_01600 [Afipia sp. Root123D2]|uniref:hypothetical protein n=1 Tax=Afipia sp. Root123D2 TaxID=1736436 RepID=UPI0007006C0C|nr:hypothetical protein [Afipia sp. Root123D2]KQW22117.1 hypothetical protein ASC80_01600 [Afipia sp. Root123D2]